MKQNLYLLLLALCVCMVSCNGNDNDPKAYDPDLKNLNRYYLQVGDDKPMQFTEILFSKPYPADGGYGYYAYNVSAKGESDENSFGFLFALACSDSTMIELGDYPYIGFSYPSRKSMYKGYFTYYDKNSTGYVYNYLEETGTCRVTKSGNDYVCEFEGTVNKDGDISNRNSIKFKVTLNKQLMTGENFKAD